MTHETITTDKVTFGFWLYIMSDCVLFAALFAAYAMLNSQTYGGSTPSYVTSLPYVLVETLLLLTSSFTVGLALLAAQYKKNHLVLLALTATLLLGLSFLGMELSEFSHLIAAGHSWGESAFLSSFFTLVGTHGLHVLLGSVWMVVLMAHILLRGLREGVVRKLLCLSLFWHFLDIIWVCIFTFVYLWSAL